VTRLVNTSDANVDEACSFAWIQLLRRQPRRETVLSWLTTVAIREAVRLDRRDRRDRHLVLGEGPPSQCQTLTYAEAFAALEVVASLPPRQRELIGLQVAGYSRQEIAVLSRVADVASVNAAVVSIDDMSSTRINAVYRSNA
jgi:DNA-directed RNA polymerase specialized sigma24 family protein